jgi:adenylate kinase
MHRSEKIKIIKSWLGAGSINIFGAPYAGKDTHGHRLAAALDAPVIGGGDILRQEHMPPHIKELHRTGKLFPQEIYLELVLPYLSQEKFDGKPLILSSIGRWHGEEIPVLKAASTAGHTVKAALYLNVNEEIIWQRWEHSDSRQARGPRDDDTKEAMRVRIKEFRDKTIPVINFYRERKLLIEIDSNQDKDMVTNSILDALIEFSRNNLTEER